MGYRSLVVLPEEMSAERFEKIRGYGADVIATPGSESNVKEIYDKVRELRADPRNRILNQFEEMGNYRFHFHCTAAAAEEVVGSLGLEVGRLRLGDGLGGHDRGGRGPAPSAPRPCASWPSSPMQCPTLYNVGFGAHRIEGIGDKHVTWIHNVWATDLLVCVDDLECLEGLQLLQEGTATLEAEGVDAGRARELGRLLRHQRRLQRPRRDPRGRPLRPRPAPGGRDGGDRRLRPLPVGPAAPRRRAGDDGRREGAAARSTSSARGAPAGSSRARPRRAAAGTTRSTSPGSSSRGRPSAELRAQEDPAWWVAHQERAHDIDRRIRERRA